jgi:hypothetical protein
MSASVRTLQLPIPVIEKLESRGVTHLDHIPSQNDSIVWNVVQQECKLNAGEFARLKTVLFPQQKEGAVLAKKKVSLPISLLLAIRTL